MKCRFCGKPADRVFASLGMSPLSNAYLKPENLGRMEPFYPLEVKVCAHCFLVQLPEFESPRNIFEEYAYFSSFSESWLKHARDYADKAVGLFGLGPASRVVEVASNDGYLLQYFAEKGVPVLGIEPAANVAEAARKKGVPTEVLFLGAGTAAALAARGMTADLVVGNNVLAHVPDLNDFVEGLKILLKPQGSITMEFPHLMKLVEGTQFDTIYHEHFSYFSMLTVEKVFAAHGLQVYDVEELPTHGGSLRIYARHASPARDAGPRVAALKAKETAAGYGDIALYESFDRQVQELKRSILGTFIRLRGEGRSVAAYGAPAKGNTLLNYCGIRQDFIQYTVDRNPYKQGQYLPGTHIPIFGPEKLRETRPDYVVILPWNLKQEIAGQVSFVREWGGRFITLVPQVEIF